MVMVFLFVIQDQRFPNRVVVIIIRFVRAAPNSEPAPRRPPIAPPRSAASHVSPVALKKDETGKRIVNEGIILPGPACTGSHFSLKLYSAPLM